VFACEGKGAPAAPVKVSERAAQPAEPAGDAGEEVESDPPPPPPKGRGMSCPNLAAHVHNVLSETGSEKTKAALPEVEQIADQCKRQRIHAEQYACFMRAATADAIDTCNRDAFGDEVDAEPKRAFNAKADNAEAEPPMFTEDGDYLRWDRHCGLLYRTVYPAGGLFVVCDGKVYIGPVVNAEELETVTARFAARGKDRRELARTASEELPAAGVGKLPYHLYDEQGAHTGVEYR
jgi:hypothetical protein